MFIVKALNNLDIEEMYLNKIKAMYDKCAANTILKNENNEGFSFKIRNEILLSPLFNIVWRS